MMFGSWGKCEKAVHIISPAVDSKEVSGDIMEDQQQSLSHNSCRHQHKINAQTAEIATMKSVLNCALEEN